MLGVADGLNSLAVIEASVAQLVLWFVFRGLTIHSVRIVKQGAIQASLSYFNQY